MTGKDLYQIAKDLELQIKSANSVRRLALQPELSRVLERLKAEGQAVPLRLRQLDATLCEEAVESWFDNLPV